MTTPISRDTRFRRAILVGARAVYMPLVTLRTPKPFKVACATCDTVLASFSSLDKATHHAIHTSHREHCGKDAP